MSGRVHRSTRYGDIKRRRIYWDLGESNCPMMWDGPTWRELQELKTRAVIRQVISAIAAFVVAMVLISVAGMLTAPGRAEETGWDMWVLCKPSGEINVREKATTHSQKGGYLGFADCVHVLDTKSVKGITWYKVDGITELGYGWVSGQFLVGDKPSLSDRDLTVTATGRVAIRDGVDGKRKAWIKPGETVHVLAESDDWALTTKGYIKMEYLH